MANTYALFKISITFWWVEMLSTHKEIKNLPMYTVTAPLLYKPKQSHRLCRVDKELDVSIEEWCTRLGYPIYNIT